VEPLALNCPNCGAGLGAAQDGHYVCAYCGHRSMPPEPPLDQAHQDERVRLAVAKHDAARFERDRAAAEERVNRGRAAAEAGLRAGARGMATSALLMLGIAAVSFAGVAYVAVYGITPFLLRNVGGLGKDSGPGVVAFLVVLGAVNVGMAAKMLSGARRTFGPRIFGSRRDMRLLAEGLPGRAIVTSYRTRDTLAAEPRFDLVLRVELAGRPAYVIKRCERVPCPQVVTTGAELPVFVDPARAQRVLIDWETAERMPA
jgi:uncharacterized Zn finger protein (UPF0148 family)